MSMATAGQSIGGAAGADTGGSSPSAGTSGVANTAGISASGGTAGGSAGSSQGGTEAGGNAGAAPDLGAAYRYTCNLVIGIQTTSEWYREFDDIADDDRWEEMHKDSAHLEKWADPAHELWATEKGSPCTQNAEEPERIVFTGVQYDYTTVEQFLPDYLAVMNNIKAKYPSVKRVDVMTYTRAPNNQECVGEDRSEYSYIKPAQDEAIAQLVSMMPGFVFATPKWEVDQCSDFAYCPHLDGAANEILGAKLATYFDGK